jgi:hypothetical protein
VTSSGDQYTVSGTGFKPDEKVTAWLHSDPYKIGEKNADGQGAVTFTFTWPDSVEPGAHQVVLTGETSGDASADVVRAGATSTPTGTATPTTTPTGTTTPTAQATTTAPALSQTGAAAWTGPVGLAGLMTIGMSGALFFLAYQRRRQRG